MAVSDISQYIPKHVAFIMDGNRRWAKEHKIPVFRGHQKGEEKIEPIIDKAIEMKIPYLTFWAFSTENWNRDKKEVTFLLNLFRNVLEKRVDTFHKKNVRLNIIGDLSKFPEDIQKKTQKWMETTKNNATITVNLALNYGGRDELIRAMNKWLEESLKAKVKSLKLRKEDLEKYLDTAGMPDPDLMIRTGGEKRLSGYLLWQMEYAEFYFTEKYWPDFTPEEFVKAVEDYSERIRRFGK